MNTTDDGSPLGEGPIDTLTAIQRAGVIGVLGAADTITATMQLAERQTQAIAAVRELHKPIAGEPLGLFKDSCAACSIPAADLYVRYPCPTILALEAGA